MSYQGLGGLDLQKLANAQVEATRDLDDGWSPPLVMPFGWVCVCLLTDGARYRHPRKHLAVILTRCRELDRKRWVHLSVSHARRLPTWSELVKIRNWMLGKDAKAIQVIPPVSEHINIHPRVLHLYHCLDEDPLPDFTHGTGSL